MSTLLFGGSFNPVHWGHLLLAEEVGEEFRFDRVLFVPALRSPFKETEADPGAGARLAMLRLACEGNPRFVVDDREIRRGGSSYTIDTLRELAREEPGEGRIGLLVGDDLLEGLPRWRDREALEREARIIVGRRLADAPDFDGSFERAHNHLIPLSSSEIRERLGRGLGVRYLLPEAVRDYILREGLYGSR